MQNVVTSPGEREHALRRETEVPFGSRVSWQGGWSGTITSLSVATILWALALAIIPLALHPSSGSLRGAAIAAWICLMIAVVVGTFFGGLLASWVRGSPRMGVGLLHGFITWALTLVLGALFGAFFLRGLLVGVINALPDVMTAPSSAPMAGTAAAPPPADRTAIDYLIGMGWSWFGTWFLALLSALAGAALGAWRARRRIESEVQAGRHEEIPPVTPLTPAPSA